MILKADPSILVRTEGAPYKPVEPVVEETFIPNEEHINFPPVPVGPLRGKIEPKNQAIKIALKDKEPSQNIDFEDYREVNDVLLEYWQPWRSKCR